MTRAEYEAELRIEILNKLDNLRHKINSGEKLISGSQDLKFFVYINNEIDGCLSKWQS